MYANLAGNPFPPGGAWNDADWRARAQQHATPNRVAAAEQALLRVFTPTWAAAIPNAPHVASPFEHWYALGGVRLLVKLGCALDIIGSPPEITNDLTVPERFNSRVVEAWSGAYFRSMGATVTWLGEGRRGPMRAEFLADWNGSAVAVEVKGSTEVSWKAPCRGSPSSTQTPST